MLGLFRRDEPTPKQIQRAVKKLTEPHGEAGPRIEAAERLAAWGTPESLFALARRFTISSRVISEDIDEKRHVIELLVDQGERAIAPLLRYMTVYHQVDWPVGALARIVGEDALLGHLQSIIERVAESDFSAPEHRVSLIRALHGHVRPEVAATLEGFLSDTDDDVRIAAIEGLAELGETARETILEAWVASEDRPRIRRRVAELFADQGWDVKGYRPTIEETLPEGFALNARGVVKRRHDPKG
jgi:HEAT repeat protein